MCTRCLRASPLTRSASRSAQNTPSIGAVGPPECVKKKRTESTPASAVRAGSAGPMISCAAQVRCSEWKRCRTSWRGGRSPGCRLSGRRTHSTSSTSAHEAALTGGGMARGSVRSESRHGWCASAAGSRATAESTQTRKGEPQMGTRSSETATEYQPGNAVLHDTAYVPSPRSVSDASVEYCARARARRRCVCAGQERRRGAAGKPAGQPRLARSPS